MSRAEFNYRHQQQRDGTVTFIKPRRVEVKGFFFKSEAYRVERWSGADEFQDNFVGTLLQPGWDVSIHLNNIFIT